MKKFIRLFVVFLTLTTLFISFAFTATTNGQLINSTISSKNPYLVRTFIDGTGRRIDEIIVPGKPPKIKAPSINIPKSNPASGIKILSDVPAFDWSYGCSATSAAMMMGYYDNHGFPNMYTGPTNGGVCPMDNSVWGHTTYSHVTCGECPLSATHKGVDGRTTKGHVDDYWIDSGNSGPDPYIGNWTEHTAADCTGDFMGTNQSKYGNSDGSTTFYFSHTGDPLYDYTGCEPDRRDGCHGLRLFAESRGYTVDANFTQYIKGQASDPDKGFTFDDYKAEIDAGRSVLIQLEGHTMIGFGYNTTGQIVYIHDTWDYKDHQMTWGGTYSDLHLQQWGVTVLRLHNNGITPPSAPQNLTATAGDSQITLNWQAPSNNGGASITNYKIYRGTTAGGESSTPIATVDANTTTYTDTSIELDTTYFYVVKAFDNQNPPNYSESSNEVSAWIGNSEDFIGFWVNKDSETRGITKVNIRMDNGKFFVHAWGKCHPTDCDWGEESTDVSDADDGVLVVKWVFSFATDELKISISKNTTLKIVSFTHFTDNSGRTDYTELDYFARFTPSVPQSLKATAITNSITLTWSSSTQGTYPIAGYAIYRGTSAGGEYSTPIATVDASVTTYTDNNVTQGTTYYYYVKAFDNQSPPNYSAPSNEVHATPQSIQNNNIALLALSHNNLDQVENGALNMVKSLGYHPTVIGVDQVKNGSVHLSDYKVIIVPVYGVSNVQSAFNSSVVSNEIKTATNNGTNWILMQSGAIVLDKLGLATVKETDWYPALCDSWFAVKALTNSPITKNVPMMPDFPENYTVDQLDSLNLPSLVWRVSNNHSYSWLYVDTIKVKPTYLLEAGTTGWSIGTPVPSLPEWRIGSSHIIYFRCSWIPFWNAFDSTTGSAGKKLLSNAINYYAQSSSPLTITTTSLPDGTVGTSYSTTLQATGGTGTYTWSIASGNLPDGLSLNSSTGVISGTPTTANTYNFTVQVSDGSETATKNLSITIQNNTSSRIISIPDTQSAPNTTVTIPINVNDADGIAGGDFTITFNSNILTATDVQLTSLTTGFLLTKNLNTPGEVRISLASTSGISDPNHTGGTLVNITFTVSASAQSGTTTILTFTNSDIKDENGSNIPSVSQNGTFTVGGMLGDVNGDNSIDSGDAILVLRYSAGLINLNSSQLVAADVNKDGTVDSGDAILILRYAAGLINHF